MGRSFLDVAEPPKPDEYAVALFGVIRQNIRKRILEEIEKDLSEAVEQAVKDLQVVVKSYGDFERMSQTVNIVLHDKRTNVSREDAATINPKGNQ
tara:strand:+ start:56 stop:340 length:285 start_codon:yes stop_codon:yes gene_type:complete